MYIFKRRAVVIIGLLTIFIAISIIICRVLNIAGLQFVFPFYIAFKFNTILCFILLGTLLPVSQLEFKNKNTLVFVALSLFIILTGIFSVLGYLNFLNPGAKVGFTFFAFYFLMVSLIFISNFISYLNNNKKQQLEAVNLSKRLEKKVEENKYALLDLSDKLKNCHGNYSALIDQSVDAINVIDLEGNFIEVNPGMTIMTGYERAELLKLNIADIIDPEQLKTDPFNNKNINREKSLLRERRFLKKNGERFDVEINAKQFTDDRILVFVHDISRQKLLEDQLLEAKLKFHTLAEKSKVGVYILQKERIIYINPRFAEVFGYQPYELINTPGSFVDLIIYDNCKETVRKNLAARYMGEIEYANYEVTGKKKDGTLNHVDLSGTRAIIDGEPTIIGTMMDVTERWKAEENLKQYEANLQTILDTTDTAYGLFDRELNLTAFNQLAADFVKGYYNHMPKIGENIKEYFPPDRLSWFLNSADEVLKGKNINYEIDYPQADGAVYWYYIRMFPITGKEGEIFGLMLALSDITERKKAEESLQSAYVKIQSHINSIKNMAWKQSHLIRSPVANLKGLFAMLHDDPLDNELIKHIKDEIERLDKVIRDLADDASGHDL